MSNKGYAFEAELAKLFYRYFGKNVDNSYRIFGSGRNKFSTVSGGERKKGDVWLSLKSFPWKIRFTTECKWYSPKGKKVKSVAIQKGWLDQARQEAYDQKSLCCFAFKIKGQSKNSKELKDYYFHGKDSNALWIAMPAKQWFLMILFFMNAIQGRDIRGKIKGAKEVSKAFTKSKKSRRSKDGKSR